MSKKGTITNKIVKKHYKNTDVADQPLSRRAAHFLNWAAENFPKQVVPWNWIYQAALGMSTTPRGDSKQVELLKQSATRIRRILQEDYKRDLTSVPGLGVRACVDSEDTLKTEMVRKSRRVQSAIESANKTASLIDPKLIPDTAENKPWRHWFTRSLRKTITDLSSDETMKKLAAPPKKDEE